MYLDWQVAERNIIDPHRDDELRILQRLLDGVGHGDLVPDTAALRLAARFRDDEYDLQSSLADSVFDADPERRAAGQVEDVGPDLVAVAGQSRSEPPNELVVVRGRVADEHNVAFGHEGI